MKIIYSIENDLDPDEFLKVLYDSILSERRPVDDRERIVAMVKNSNLIVTARENGKLIGVARSLSDYVYATYLSDLAVGVKYQKLGIGKELIRQTKAASPKAKLILLSAPAAIEYYPKIGMKQHVSCFFLDDMANLK
jgi:predicted N-acetyltransferase YhbS